MSVDRASQVMKHRLNPQTRSSQRDNGKVRTKLPDEQHTKGIGGAKAPQRFKKPEHAPTGKAERLARMRLQTPAGVGAQELSGEAPPISAPAGIPQSPEDVVARYIDAMRQRLVQLNGE